MSKNCKSMFQQHPDFQDWANRKPDNRTTVFTIDVPGSKTEACYPHTNPGKFGWCKTRSPVCRVWVDDSCNSPLLLCCLLEAWSLSRIISTYFRIWEEGGSALIHWRERGKTEKDRERKKRKQRKKRKESVGKSISRVRIHCGDTAVSITSSPYWIITTSCCKLS